jgi:hypothetical protein
MGSSKYFYVTNTSNIYHIANGSSFSASGGTVYLPLYNNSYTTYYNSTILNREGAQLGINASTIAVNSNYFYITSSDVIRTLYATKPSSEQPPITTSGSKGCLYLTKPAHATGVKWGTTDTPSGLSNTITSSSTITVCSGSNSASTTVYARYYIYDDLNNTTLYSSSNSRTPCSYTCSSSGTSCSSCGTSGRNACLIAGTKVLMADGVEKNIEDIYAGMDVLSYNSTKNCLIPSKVKNVFISNKNESIYKVTLSNGAYIYITKYHPIATKNGYKTIKTFDNDGIRYAELKIGEELLYKDLKYYKITNIIRFKFYKTVYNILVEDDNFIANGIVVLDEDLDAFTRLDTIVSLDSARCCKPTTGITCPDCSSSSNFCPTCSTDANTNTCTNSVAADGFCQK